MTPWLLVDYGEVISLSYDPDSLPQIAQHLDVAVAVLQAGYWRHRPGYDAGEPSGQYWAKVVGRTLTAQELLRVDEIDLRGWGRINPDTLDLLAEQRSRGARLALLSNAPHNQAVAFGLAPWAELFEQRFVSSELGVIKPSPEVFHRVLEVLSVTAADVTFIDDRADNIATAQHLGFRAVLFTTVPALRRALD